MSITKPQIYNLAFGLMLLQRRVTDPDTDPSNEVKVLNTHYEMARDMTLEDCNLDSTATEFELALVEEDPTDEWLYAYDYPADCVCLRRIKPACGTVVDNRTTHVPKLVRIHDGEKVIFTNEVDAVAEIIEKDLDVSTFTSQLAWAIACRLAALAAPLIVGKGAKSLVDSIERKYLIAKAEAQERDKQENFNFVDEAIESEFVEARTS